MSDSTKMLFRFSYYTSLWLILVSIYCLISIRDISSSFFIVVLAIAFFIWCSVGHFSDFIFDTKSLIKFKLLSENIGDIKYVDSCISWEREDFSFYLIIEDELYNVYFTHRIEKEIIEGIEMKYDISVVSEFSGETYVNNKHIFTRTIDFYNNIIKKQCVKALSETEKPFDFILNAKRIEKRAHVIDVLARRRVISEILNNLENDTIQHP